ncbi:MAG: hypothetical protein IIX50_07230, partial [Bacteroidaceae bacterium]|nr:hypothetical protein [Bacteroidaceae bacterium]
MKKFFKVLLLAAVALMPVMGMAQNSHSPETQYERSRQIQQYEDSVAGARQAQLDRHAERMAQIDADIRKNSAIRGEDVLIVLIIVCIIAAGIAALVLCLRHSRKKAEDHKELINKLIDNNLLNSTEPISKEAIEALMKPKKSDKDKFITDATLVGLGLGIGFGSGTVHGGVSDILEVAAFILLFLGALRLVIRTIFMIIGYFSNKKRKSKIEAKEAEVVEE